MLATRNEKFIKKISLSGQFSGKILGTGRFISGYHDSHKRSTVYDE